MEAHFRATGSIRTLNLEVLGQLGLGGNGAVVWAPHQSQLGMSLGALTTLLDGSAATLEARFRIRAQDAGTFAPGRTVLGTARFEVCPWDCIYYDVSVRRQDPVNNRK